MVIDDACNYIHINSSGIIVYQSIFQKEFDGDFELLMSLIEDNIYIDNHRAEYINWQNVIKQYGQK